MEIMKNMHCRPHREFTEMTIIGQTLIQLSQKKLSAKLVLSSFSFT